jgi:universal stress protein E
MSLKLLVALKPGSVHTNAVKRAREFAAGGDIDILIYSTVFDNSIDSIRYISAEEKKALENGMLEIERTRLRDMASELALKARSVNIEIEWNKKPELAIAAAAERFCADLAIVSCGTHSKLSRTFFNHVDSRILRHMKVPVLIANDKPSAPYKTIIVAVDPGHKGDLENKINHGIVSEARKMAARFGSELFLAHAYPSELSVIDSEYIPPMETMAQWKLAATENMMAFAQSVDVDSDHVLLSGLPISFALSTLVEEKQADLLVLGVHSRSAIGEFFLGNTAERMLSSVQSDVLACHFKA